MTLFGGYTLTAFNASAVWDDQLNQARLDWTPSSNVRLDRPVARAATRFATTAGLVAPGAAHCFKVYVATQDGNEAGSNRLKITRLTSAG